MKKELPSYPVFSQDVFNYLSAKYFANNQLSYVIKLNGRINETLLRDALTQSLAAEPVLGCRFIERDEQAIWLQHPDLKRLELCSVVETDNSEKEVQQFIASPHDFERDCQIKATIIRSVTDTLCIKVNHACCDAGGFKRYLTLLLSIYEHLYQGRQYFIPPNPSANRSQEPIFQSPAIAAWLKTANTEIDMMPTVALPFTPGKDEAPFAAVGQTTPAQFERLKKQAHAHSVTINDLLLTAYLRTLGVIAEAPQKTIAVCNSVDLRRYLPDQTISAVSNLSGMNLIRGSCAPAESFAATLRKVAAETTHMKNNQPGINMALFIATHGSMPFKDADLQWQGFKEMSAQTNLCNPWLSNVGILAEKPVSFGSATAIDCYMIGPAFFAPAFMLLTSTYNNVLTLSINFFQSTLKKAVAEQIIHSILDDLQNC
ncbi:condensation domain-containing protein [Azotosporobacter soli]|uniref:condensation domain-containing protein n=1 Tax=Azotosporobacter soli TaxID=3055040 RepID=UPI0031FF1DCB